MSGRVERIRTLLQEALAPAHLEVDDDSHLHAGHAGAASGGGHYRVKIVSERFEGQRLVMRHRLVYDAVQSMMHTDIHALAITAIAPSEQGWAGPVSGRLKKSVPEYVDRVR